ncbi:MAG: hypothetical protein K2K66_02765 [Ruminococcus sp.]|nr:hypothetical protein [Ruminococcus sp.]
MKKTLLTCSIFLTCMAFVSCGNNDNSYSSDGEMIITEYTTEKSRKNDKNDDRYYDDDYYETDENGNVDTDDTDGVGDETGSNNTVKDHAHDAVDGVENAGESIVDGVGDAVGDVIDGAGNAVDDVIDGLDGETTATDYDENNQ